MKDCEIVKGLILAAFDRDHENDVTLEAALDLYARMMAAENEKSGSEKTAKKTEKTIEKPAKTAEKKENAKLSVGGGPGADEKRATLEKLRDFRNKNGLGSFQTLAEATMGKLDTDTIRAIIQDMPTVDAEPVGRCKDCVMFQEKYAGFGICAKHTGIWKKTDFCADGRACRRNDGEDNT